MAFLISLTAALAFSGLVMADKNALAVPVALMEAGLVEGAIFA